MRTLLGFLQGDPAQVAPRELQGSEWSANRSSLARGSSVEALRNAGNEAFPNITELLVGARYCVKVCGKHSGE